MITALLAAYDSGHASLVGDYWVWKHPALSTRQLNAWHEHLISSHRSDVEKIGSEDCCGGALALDPDWCCFYRFYNAGRDGYGRPGRYILLCAVLERATAVGIDLSRFVETGYFADIARRQPISKELSAPAGYELTVDESVVRIGREIPSSHLAAGIERTHTPEQFWPKCASFDRRQPFHWRLERRQGAVSAKFVDVATAASVSPSTAIGSTAAPPRENPPRGGQATPTTSPQQKPYGGKGTPMRRIARSIAFRVGLVVLGIAAGITGTMVAQRHGWIKTQNSTPVDLDAMVRWLERDHHELLRRIQADDWSSPESGRSEIPTSTAPTWRQPRPIERKPVPETREPHSVGPKPQQPTGFQELFFQ